MVEIVLAPDGTRILRICNRCLVSGADDENCGIERAALAYAQALLADGEAGAWSDPGDDVPGFDGPETP
jgi:hypothetical protein